MQYKVERPIYSVNCILYSVLCTYRDMVYEIVCKYTKSSPNTHFDNALDRASKSCRRADTRLRKVLKNLRKIWTFERKTGTLHFL